MKGIVALGVLVVVGSVAILLPTFVSDDESLPRLVPGLDLQGGASWVYRVDVPDGVDARDAAVQATEVVRNRLEAAELDAMVTSRSDSVIVELSGADAEEVHVVSELVGRHASFEIRMVDEGSSLVDELELPAGIERHLDTHGSAPHAFLVADDREVLEQLGRDELAFGRVGSWEESFDPARERWRTYAVQEARITGVDVADAYVATNPDGTSSVMVTFGARGAQVLDEITRRGVGDRLAIIVNGEVMSAPVIRAPIPGGRAQIQLGRRESVAEALAEAHDLAITLRAGSLPNPLVLESEFRIEATQPVLAWSIPFIGLGLFILVAIGGLRRPLGAVLALPLLVFVAGFATLALMRATANVALMAGVLGAALAVLVAVEIGRGRFDPTLPKVSRLLVLATPAAVCFVMLLGAGVAFGIASGPARAAAAAVLATSLVACPLSALWMWASAKSAESP